MSTCTAAKIEAHFLDTKVDAEPKARSSEHRSVAARWVEGQRRVGVPVEKQGLA